MSSSSHRLPDFKTRLRPLSSKVGTQFRRHLHTLPHQSIPHKTKQPIQHLSINRPSSSPRHLLVGELPFRLVRDTTTSNLPALPILHTLPLVQMGDLGITQIRTINSNPNRGHHPPNNTFPVLRLPSLSPTRFQVSRRGLTRLDSHPDPISAVRPSAIPGSVVGVGVGVGASSSNRDKVKCTPKPAELTLVSPEQEVTHRPAPCSKHITNRHISSSSSSNRSTGTIITSHIVPTAMVMHTAETGIPQQRKTSLPQKLCRVAFPTSNRPTRKRMGRRSPRGRLRWCMRIMRLVLKKREQCYRGTSIIHPGRLRFRISWSREHLTLPYLTLPVGLRESESVEAGDLFSTYRGILFGVYIFFSLTSSPYLLFVLRLRDMDSGDNFFQKNKPFISWIRYLDYHATTINPPARRDETERKKREETQMQKTIGGQS